MCHAGPIWKRDDPRVTILHAYSHLATHWHRLNVPPVVRKSHPPSLSATADFPDKDLHHLCAKGSCFNLAFYPQVLRSLPREKLAYFREPWIADFSSAEKRASGSAGAIHNTADRFVAKEGFDDVIDTSHNAPGGVWRDSQTARSANSKL